VANIHASTANNKEQEALCFRVVRPLSVNTYFLWRDISVLGGGVSIKLGTNINDVSGNCSQGFQDQRSKVKVIARSNAVLERGHYISTVASRLTWRTNSSDPSFSVRNSYSSLHVSSDCSRRLLAERMRKE